ncbi:tRNA (adenosine(37)-N6)-threonylcarbamoyltransferase complex ATPase subunit type 1 TsaE [Lactobacillus delbrueckii]|uniref:tRNA (adenosine(37)-N6)-threonylcarbamoyltransferase complex ATPase subunit type 1 TsaE n=1 Tax=Lactobacillus delbrueckii TaxID=1584 RepID=UPI001E560973|nr:tRNA (adenosine(37)-N6)-threonylcarbamoyltransferase complex ATPase subunit type 1 TsaE [Lactobacillus delbrueckii]MCD5450983.1 tRNA (adenosine(37)-N6)-threonylcarbamoyltransferase complex ATPase subunit type 1 TsaE [Lactobacillus delbrueckii subsp. lactis]
MTELAINSASDMQAFGASLAQSAQPHDLLLLKGDLGAGKTTLTQGFGRALGIKRPVKSPTFTLVREYREGKLPLFHMDFYRLEGDDLASIDLNDYLAEEGVVIIEWPQVIQADLPSDFLELVLTRVDDSWDSTKRLLELIPHGQRAAAWVENACRFYQEKQ